MQYLQQHPIEIELSIFVVSVLALLVSISAKHYAEKAFTLALFDKRYKLYDDFKNTLASFLYYDNAGASNFVVEQLLPNLSQANFLFQEAKYMFSEDISFLLAKIKEHTSGTVAFFAMQNAMATGERQEDLQLVSQFKVEHYDVLLALINDLLGDDETVNLYSYFSKYLEDEDFRKPLTATFFRRCRKCIVNFLTGYK